MSECGVQADKLQLKEVKAAAPANLMVIRLFLSLPLKVRYLSARFAWRYSPFCSKA